VCGELFPEAIENIEEFSPASVYRFSASLSEIRLQQRLRSS